MKPHVQRSLQPCSSSLGMQAGDALSQGRAEPAEGAVAALSRRDARLWARSTALFSCWSPAGAMSALQLQLCLPRAANPCAEPSLAVSVGTGCLEKPQGCPFPKAGARSVLECHLTCTAFWGSLAHLWNGWLMIRPSEGIRLNTLETSVWCLAAPTACRSCRSSRAVSLVSLCGDTVGSPYSGLWPTHANRDAQQWGSSLTKLGQAASWSVKPGVGYLPSLKKVSLLNRAVQEDIIYLPDLFVGTFNLIFCCWCSAIDFFQPVLQELLSVFTGPDRREKLMSFIAWSIHGLLLGRIKYSILIQNLHYWELYQC